MHDEPNDLEELAAELRLALADDAVPPEVLRAAQGAWAWRLIDTELAELVEEERAVLRTDQELFTFSAPELFIDLQRTRGPQGRTVTLTGQVTSDLPVENVVVELASDPALRLEAELDESGTFFLETSAEHSARVVVDLAGGRRVASPWFTP